MLSLTVHGCVGDRGEGRIGGNQILVEDSGTRFFFDFGIPYAQRTLYFEEFLNPRPGAGLLDPLEMGLLPPLRGIYRPDLEPPGNDLWPRLSSRPGFRELTVDGVLLSHAHMDHAGYISFLAPEIPVFATPETAFILKTMEDTDKGSIGFEREVCYIRTRQDKDGYLTSARGVRRQRPFAFLSAGPLSAQALEYWNTSDLVKKNAMQTTAPLEDVGHVGGLDLAYSPVDHSIPGACSLAVQTSLGWLAYTGDLRAHGARAATTAAFVQRASQLRPYLLLGEGSRAGQEGSVCEEEVFDNCLAATRAAKGLVIADFAPRNVERLLAFYEVARRTGRNLAVLPKDAHLLEKLSLVSSYVPPLSSLPRLLIFQELKGTMSEWEKALLQTYGERVATQAQVRACPCDFILCFSFWDINNLIDLAPNGGVYIYSSSEAYSEEQEMDFRRLLKWLEHFGMAFAGDENLHRRFQDQGQCPKECPFCSAPKGTVRLSPGFHASGHASGVELVEMIKAIRPKVFVPIHTEKPDYFREALKGSDIEVRLPVGGTPMVFG